MRWLLLVMLAAWLLIRFTGTVASWLDYPSPRGSTEGIILYESLLVKHSENIYAPITVERFVSGSHPPIYYWLAAALLPSDPPPLTEPGAVSSVLQPGRFISLLAALFTAALLPLLIIFEGGYGTLGRRSISIAAAAGAMAGVLFLSLPPVLVWATRFQGDMLMLALTAAGLTCIAAGARSEQRSHQTLTEAQHPGTQSSTLIPYSSLLLVAGAIFFSLALFTKQSALAGPLASASYLLVRDRKMGLKWCGIMALAVIIPFVLLDLTTGHWFYMKVVEFQPLRIQAPILVRLFQNAFLEDQWPLVLAALSYLLYQGSLFLRARREGANLHLSLLIPLFAIASIFTLPMGVVIVADHNQLLMLGLAMSACTGASLGTVARPFSADARRLLFFAPAPVAVLLIVIYGIFTAAPSSWYGADLRPPPPEWIEQTRKIAENASQNGGSALFSDEPGILAIAGKETPYSDPFTMTALAQQGRWDETHYRNMLREGKFSLLVLSCDAVAQPRNCRPAKFTPGVLDSIREGYQVLFPDVFFTYVPQ